MPLGSSFASLCQNSNRTLRLPIIAPLSLNHFLLSLLNIQIFRRSLGRCSIIYILVSLYLSL